MPDRAGLWWSDAALLTRLADALAPEDVLPTEAGLAALRAALDARTSWPAGPADARTTRRPWTLAGRSRRGLAALGLIGGVFVGGTGVAVATGASLPEPVRMVVHHLGLPAGSPARWRALHTEQAPRAARTRSATTRTAAPPQSLPGPGHPGFGPGGPLATYRDYSTGPPDRPVTAPWGDGADEPGPPGPGTQSTYVPDAAPAPDRAPEGSGADGAPSGHDPVGQPGPEPGPANQSPSGPGSGGHPEGYRPQAAAVWAGGEQPRR